MSGSAFSAAIGPWRGVALAGLDSSWAVATRELLAAELDVADLRLQLGRHAALVPERAAALGLGDRPAARRVRQYALDQYRDTEFERMRDLLAELDR